MRNSNINFVFIGGTYRGFKLFESLVKTGNIPCACFILEEDQHEILKYSKDILKLAAKNKIPYFIRRKLLPKDYDFIKARSFDFGIVCGWRTKINPELNKFLKFGLVALHDSLLPKYRGFAPINWAIINGEKETGITLFLINDLEIDSGYVIEQKRVKINDDDFANDVSMKVTAATVDICLNFLNDYRKGSIKLRKQNENKATYTCKRTPRDGKICWYKTAKEIYNLIRGLAHPYPGAFCYYKNRIYHIRKARLPNKTKKYAGIIPGRVIKSNDSGIEVLCQKGSIIINEWENKAKKLIQCPSQTIKSITALLT